MTIVLDNDDDLFDYDLGLLFGYFNIADKEIDISLFKENYCDIPSSLESLSSLMMSDQFQKGRELVWKTLENNEVSIQKDKNQIKLVKQNVQIQINYLRFISALRTEIECFKNRCLAANPNLADSGIILTVLKAQKDLL